MDEERILELAKAAVELDELDAAVARQTNLRGGAASGTGSPWRWWTIGGALSAAAVLAVVFTLPPRLVINEMSVSAPEVRGTASFIKIDLGVSRPAYVRIVFIDERFERWVIPITEENDTFATQIDGDKTIWGNLYPKPDDPRGPAKAIAVLAILSLEPTPSVDQLLASIPDPILPAEADAATLVHELERLRVELGQRFDCVCAVDLVPGPPPGPNGITTTTDR